MNEEIALNQQIKKKNKVVVITVSAKSVRVCNVIFAHVITYHVAEIKLFTINK